MELLVNNNDISNLCTSMEYYDEMISLIGNAISRQIKIQLINKDNQLDTLLDYPFIIDGKTYIIFDKPEKWTKNISLTLYDLMIKSNVAYNTEILYPCTIYDQLIEMSEIIGVEIDVTTLSNEVLNKTVGWYDNTVIVREYLGWIAECDGKNAFIENDKIVFKPIARDTHFTDFCSDYELIEKYTISRICFDNGVIDPLSKGNEKDRTLYLSESNPYIEQNDIDRIYELYNGLSFNTIKKFECLELPNFKLTDLVNYDDEIVILPISQKVTVYGGEAFNRVTFSCEISIKTMDDVVVVEDTKKKIKRIQTVVNQLEGDYSVLSQDIEDSKSKISQFSLDSEAIQQKVTLLDEKVEGTETIINSINTSLITQSDKITFLQSEDIEIKDALSGKVDTISLEKWLRWDGTQMEMGASTDDFKVLLSRFKLAFLEAGVETTWLSNQELWANFVQAKNRISVGEGDGIDGNDNRLSLVDEGDLGYSLV